MHDLKPMWDFMESRGSHVSHRHRRCSCRSLGLGGSRCELLLSCLGRELSTALQVGDKLCLRPPSLFKDGLTSLTQKDPHGGRLTQVFLFPLP